MNNYEKNQVKTIFAISSSFVFSLNNLSIYAFNLSESNSQENCKTTTI